MEGMMLTIGHCHLRNVCNTRYVIDFLPRVSNVKVWKVRLEAYEEVNKLFQNSSSDNDECFGRFLKSPDLLRKMVMDNNVVAQEAGISAICSFLEFGGSNACTKTRSQIISAIAEKGLGSTRPGTKQKSINALLWYIELDVPDPVIESLLPALSAKLPKLVAGVVAALNEIYSNFGCKVCPPKLVLDVIPQLFAHADKNVRAETTILSITLRSYMGTAFDTIIFEKLKPIQQKDLAKAFEKIEGTPTPKRFLRSHQVQIAETKTGLEDVSMIDAQEVSSDQLDAFDLIDPVEVLSKIPSDFKSRIESSKWKDRVEVLEEVLTEFKYPKLKNDDYMDLIRVLSKCLKDANIQVVTLASKIIEKLGSGLQQDFHRYVSILISPLLERTKEKKQSVLDAISAALDVCFKFSSISELLEPTLQYMSHKTPQIKIESSRYLIRCLKQTETIPKKQEIDSIMQVSLRLMSDSLAPVRDLACEITATLVKIAGERQLRSYLEGIDSRKTKKIDEYSSSCEVKTIGTKQKSGGAYLQKVSAPATFDRNGLLDSAMPAGQSLSATPNMSKTSEPSLTSRKLASTSTTIPSKRGPSSPLKSSTATGKMNLTSRTLKPTNSQSLNRAQCTTPSLNSSERELFESLKAEKLEWNQKRKEIQSQLDTKTEEIARLNKKLDDQQARLTEATMAVKSKDIQLSRLQSDLDQSESKIRELQYQLQQALSEKVAVKEEPNDNFNFSLQKLETLDSKSDLNRRISDLSIHNGMEKENYFGSNTGGTTSTRSKFSSGLYDVDSNDDSWRKAAEVTNQLKARIEMMKSKSRTFNQL
ncbi:hypothetical protein KL930_003999 [Ogataea haglerorum]|uniref:TOG domain-containing protein n=1 Tax=Ogataea haglerorum TaxID=1937702 RepID=A0AAN6DAB0_9ASCO|nr:uncharacterized protein KL911_001344 [Ogataea haglerorum]KAG7693397.1 hypothetical protein KL915_004296 [Ogataea haglerorum]KAG7711920.1 hypothetical protein KL914_000562 [Ogataea haglerorum]KAG7712691.1 hypothetical protein KL950_000562 [Ogataea haglerorum]KAG7722742.1 hypothetical protein KL913_000562 [Ogataea haglerorum]KAG7723157.1 hypothetical protein KL949_000207 [Ogataea haglerorum]